jgi:L-alanine-DL-glutamate epimerase-like enolase superfamily enzyme
LPAYASDRLWYSLSLDELAESARVHVAQGFQAVKLRLGKEVTADAEAQRVRAVRQAVGTDIRILVDATESWERAQATRTGRRLQEEGIAWLEDPVHHRDLVGLSHLAGLLEIPVAGGEHLYELTAFKDVLQAGAVDVMILDLGRVGGITPWRHIASLAQAFHVPICGHVIPEIHVHLLAAIPNAFMVEYVPRSAAILQQMPAIEDGCLVAPKSPGLGLELDDNAVGRYRVG